MKKRLAEPEPEPEPPKKSKRYKRARAKGYMPVIRNRRVYPAPSMSVNQGAASAQELRQNRGSFEAPPGNPLNPNVVDWYYQKAFEPKYKSDSMSIMYPWLFGSQGLYGGMVTEECEYPCEYIDGACICPY